MTQKALLFNINRNFALGFFYLRLVYGSMIITCERQRYNVSKLRKLQLLLSEVETRVKYVYLRSDYSNAAPFRMIRLVSVRSSHLPT